LSWFWKICINWYKVQIIFAPNNNSHLSKTNMNIKNNEASTQISISYFFPSNWSWVNMWRPQYSENLISLFCNVPSHRFFIYIRKIVVYHFCIKVFLKTRIGKFFYRRN
jgi:hypothetical protein